MFIKLFANCLLVKGYAQTTICDVQKGRYIIIPNKLYDILEFINKHNVSKEKLLALHPEEQEGLSLYIEYFISEGYLFETTFEGNFPPLPLEFDYPAFITNSIIDIDENSRHIPDCDKIIALGCKTFQLRFFEPVTKETITETVMYFNRNSHIKNIQVVLPYFDEPYLSGLATAATKVTLYIYYNSPMEKDCFDENNIVQSVYLAKTLDESSCGVINRDQFTVNIKMFTESVHFNNCLNRKLTVDRHGNIKNCPALPNSFGKISTTNIKEVMMNKKFTSIWKLKKDKISICKDCEFRYICSDCRAFTLNSDIKGKPAKCTYSPYTNTWS